MFHAFSFSQFGYHLAVIVALGSVPLFIPRRRFSPAGYNLILGVVFGFFTLISMLNPIEVREGIFYDGRTVLISLCSLFFGPLAAAASSILAILCRISIGGVGTSAGVMTVLLAAGLGLLFRRFHTKPEDASPLYLWLFGLVVHLATLAGQFVTAFVAPIEFVWDVLHVVGLPILLLYPLATVMLGKILAIHCNQERILNEARNDRSHMEDVLMHAPAPLAISDSSGRIVMRNARFLELFGYGPEEVATVEDWMTHAYPDPEYREQARRDWKEGLELELSEGRYAYPIEYRVRTKWGTDLHVEISGTLFGNDILVSFSDITARKQAEVSVRESLQLLTNLANQVPGVVYQYRYYPDGRSCFPYASEGIREIYEVSPEEVREDASLVFSRLHPDDLERITEEIVESARMKTHFHSEFRVILPEKGLRWRLCDASPELMPDGSTLWHGIITDISEDRKREEELRLLGVALNAAANAIVITDANGIIVWVNDAFTSVTQYKKEEAQGKNPSELVKSGEHDDAFYNSMWTTLSAGQVWRGTLVNRRKDGSLYTEEQSITPMRDGHGVITHYVGVKQDVTERVRTEKELLESQSRLQRALTIGNIALWDWDLITEHVYFSPEWSGHTGALNFGRSEKVHEWFDRVHPEDLPLLQRTLMNCRKDGHPNQREFRLRHDAGEYHWILMNASPVSNEQGRVTRMVGTNVDITERRRLETEFQQAQKLESVGRLAGGVAHDFNNLLSVIGGYSEMALASVTEGTPLHKDLMQVKRAADRAAGLTRQLLAFSRRQVLSPEVLNVNTIIGEAEKMLRRLIGEDIDLQLNLAEDLGQAMADPGQVEQVLLNLSVNARDAMPQGGTLTIATSNVNLSEALISPHANVPAGRYIRISVSDTGIGMSRELFDKIFEPFFTTKESGKGTGLGLATVYGIVKQSEGYIVTESTLGVGTTFHIFLPRLDEAELQASKDEPPEVMRGTETILVVEDEENLREVACRFLKQAGYTVLRAGSGDEALRVAAESTAPIALLLSDVIMPGMSGPVLAEKLREQIPALKVLYMSGYTDDALAHHGVLEPNISLIMKPFTGVQLASKVRELLGSERDV